jgi:hypothetical protein
MKSITSEEPKPLPETVSPLIKGLISKLLDKNPVTRPDAKTLLAEMRNYVDKIVTKVSSVD